MKKILYYLLLLAELFVGSLLLSGLWLNGIYVPLFATVAGVLALLVWQIIAFIKAKDNAAKRQKIKLNIFLIMMIPTVVFFFTFFVIAISMIIAF